MALLPSWRKRSADAIHAVLVLEPETGVDDKRRNGSSDTHALAMGTRRATTTMAALARLDHIVRETL